MGFLAVVRTNNNQKRRYQSSVGLGVQLPADTAVCVEIAKWHR
jgi:hypothetical protein